MCEVMLQDSPEAGIAARVWHSLIDGKNDKLSFFGRCSGNSDRWNSTDERAQPPNHATGQVGTAGGGL